MPIRCLLAASLILSCLTATPMKAAGPATPDISNSRAMTYRNVAVKGLNIFYREAGPSNAPAILLLHGFPSSSRMFDTLMPLLADRYHLIAPDYPGFGNSEAPSPESFSYTFDTIADIVDAFTQAIHLDRYALYLQNYGGPVGYRVAVAHPERVTALIIQNAIAHEQGLGRLQAVRKGFWADRAANEEKYRAGLASLDVARLRHVTARRIRSATIPISGRMKLRAFLNDHQSDTPGYTTALYLEALAAAARLARAAGDTQRHCDYLESCRHGFQFLDGLIIQTRDASLLPNPAMAIGGLRRSSRSSEVCVDFVQHYLAALIEIREAIEAV